MPPLLISWPMAWPFCTYRLLHRLHHRWNNRDLRDPERIRHQEPGRWRWLVLAGGAGLILHTLQEALRLQAQQPDRRLCSSVAAAGPLAGLCSIRWPHRLCR